MSYQNTSSNEAYQSTLRRSFIPFSPNSIGAPIHAVPARTQVFIEASTPVPSQPTSVPTYRNVYINGGLMTIRDQPVTPSQTLLLPEPVQVVTSSSVPVYVQPHVVLGPYVVASRPYVYYG